MPEVPEITLTTEILEFNLKNQMLTSFHFVAGRFQRNNPVNYENFQHAQPLKLITVNSKGKFIWFDFIDTRKGYDSTRKGYDSTRKGYDSTNAHHWYIWNTLGLTGLWTFDKPAVPKAILVFENRTLYFADMRNFGTFKFSQDKLALKKKLSSLAPDFLKSNVDLSPITTYHSPIVKVLMNQQAIGSGLGNYLTAEILYRAKISPHRLSNTLTANQIERLTYWIKYMTKLCYTNNGVGYMKGLEAEAKHTTKKNYHADIKLDSHAFAFQVYRRKIDPLGNAVLADKIIAGRTTYWVPAIQK